MAGSTVIVWVVLAVGASGAFSVAAGVRTPGVLGLLGALAWPGVLLVGWPGPAYAVGLVAAPWWAPLLAVTCVNAVRGMDSHRGRLVIMALAALAVVAGWARALVYEPFADPNCHRRCVHGPFVVDADLGLARICVVIGAVAIAALAIVVIVEWVRGLRDLPPAASTWALMMAAVALVALFAENIAVLLDSGRHAPETAGDPIGVLHLLGALAVVGLLVGLAVERLLLVGRMRDVRLALTVGSERGASAILTSALRDPRALVGHWVDGVGFLEQTGGALAPVAAGRRRTALSDHGETIAVIDHDARVPADLLQRSVGPAVRAAIAVEGLEVRLTRDVAELTRSRSRIVTSGDAERVRLERDLHDGAQQAVLALSIDLQRARTSAQHVLAGDQAGFEVAEQATRELLGRLREVARGFHPAVLEGSGLAAALHQLADASEPPFFLFAGDIGRFSTSLERTAYTIAREAATAGLDELAVEADDVLVLRVSGAPAPASSVADRVAVAGGTLTTTNDGWEVRLPCG